MEITLESLGLTKKAVEKKLLDVLARQIMNGTMCDEDGEEVQVDASFARRLQTHITKQVDETVAEIATRSVLPNVDKYIKELVLQKTNSWGEKKGKGVTFTEYLIQRAEAYMKEEVDYNGKPKNPRDSYSWSASGTRVALMIEKYLHHEIERAMTQAVANANVSIVGGLEKTVKLKLAEIQDKLKVTVETK